MQEMPPQTQPRPLVPEDRHGVARVTYRFLRWMMVLLPMVLFVVTTGTALQQGDLESSISAYYGGPVRDVFVGVMVATAACMIAYQGASMVEDYTLNGAGFYAVFVALVPSNLAATLAALGSDPAPDGVTPADYVWFLRISLTTVLVLCAVLLLMEIRDTNRLRNLWASGPWNKAFVVVTSVVLLLFLALAMAQLWLHPADEVTMPGVSVGPWRLRIHDLAAILLIAALAVAVWSHAWPKAVAGARVQPADLAVAGRYRLIFVAMLLGPVVAAGVHEWVSPDHTVIFLEWWEILAFCLFWILETRRIALLEDGAVDPGRVAGRRR